MIPVDTGYVWVALHGKPPGYPFPNEKAACRFALNNRTTEHAVVVFDSNGVVLHLYPRKRVKK